MLRNTLILITLFSYSFLMYFPLNKKEIGLNNDDLCYYKDGTDTKYVKPCNEGYYCNLINEESGICLEYKPGFKKYKEKCNQDSDCYPSLKCENNLCVEKENDSVHQYDDKVSNKTYYYCPDNLIPTNQTHCLTKIDETNKDKCPIDTNMKTFSYDYLKICGEIDIDKKYASNSNFGIVDDNKFVGDVLACKSGFALFFFKDRGIEYNANNNNQSFLVCVTVKHVEKEDNNNCIIKYSIDNETELTYYKAKVDDSLYDKNEFPDCNLIMTKIELFKDYLNKFNKLNTHCINGQFYNEPFTCENDELRKSWYYYNHPDQYLLYKDNEEIIDFLIQSYYPTHNSNETEQENNKNSSRGLLNNKYFLILLLLFI